MRFLLISSVTLIIYFLSSSITFAASNQVVTIVNPIRGSDFFQLEGVKPVNNIKNQWEKIKGRNLPATWLVRPDALSDSDVTFLLKGLPQSQEIGLFMEITPTWAKYAGLNYRESNNWHSAGSVFLTGYEVSERKKLIDIAFEKFKNIFGFYPKSVGAWWIDAGSLEYMYKKYGLLANMDVADQYTTDNYQVWGQYFSLPFYPSKRNALIPAQGLDQKIGVVTIQWANRDPFNAYGNGVLDSTYSVQANDYANKKYHDLDTNYFKKLLSIYLDNPYSELNQVTIGLENDFSWDEFGEEFVNQLDEVKKRQLSGVKVLTMSEFSNIYKLNYLVVSPEVAIFADDPLGSFGKVLWLQNSRYRVGWFYNQKGSVIRDLRLFYNAKDEPCLTKSCNSLNLAMLETKNLDEVSFGDSWVIDEGRISDIKLSKITDGWRLNYVNQAGIPRTLEFLPSDIRLNGQLNSLPVVISQAIESSKNILKLEQHFNYTLTDGWKVLKEFGKNLIIFLVFSILFFYLPATALLKKVNLENSIKVLLSIPLGISTFTVASFVFGYLHFSLGLLLLPIVALLYIRKDFYLPKIFISKNLIFSVSLIIIGSITWLLTTFKNGLPFDFGFGFWGPHGHDAMWHLSIVESLKRGLPPENSIFSGTELTNYHYFYDLLLAETSKFTTIASLDLYFRFFPLIISIGIGVLTYLLAKEWFRSNTASNLTIFFVYFGGSFGWIVSYFRNKTLGGESLFWSQQSISTLINPPYALSILIFLAGLYLLRKAALQKDQLTPLLIPLTVIWGSLIEFKVYAGVLVLGALTIVSIVEIFKRNFKFLRLSVLVVALSLIVYLPNNLGSSSLLVFAPFWLIHSMIDSVDRVNFFRLSLARVVGMESGNWLKFLGAEAAGFIIFLAGNLGTRITGFFNIKLFWPLDIFNLFILSFLSLAILLPLVFTQKGAGFNIVQFFYYFLFVFNFLAAASLTFLIGKLKKLGWVVVAVVVFMTLPTTWDTLHHYLPKRPPATIPQKEIEALEFLKGEPDGIVLSYYFDKNLKEKFDAPKPLFAYESTAYVGAFSGKPEFIADTVNLAILGIDYKGRLQSQKDIFAMKEPEILKKLLKEGNIKYIYAPKFSNFTPDEEKFGIKRIFNNEGVDIFRVI